MGTRLRPVTYEIPKPLIPVKKRPIISHLIRLLGNHDIDDIGILINKDHEEDFTKWRHNEKESVKMFTEPKPHGTFGWLKNLRHWLGEEPFIVINGDTLLDIDITKLKSTHEEHKPVATLALVHTDDSNARGVAELEGNHVISFAYEREVEGPRLISAGCVVFNPEVFSYAPSNERVMIEDDILPKLAQEKKLNGIHFKDGRCYDCGTFARWERAIKEW
jgi:mannose-1-phosphate guanylyltransferase